MYRSNSLNANTEAQFSSVTRLASAKFRLIPHRMLLAKVVNKENASLNEIQTLRMLTRTEGKSCKHIVNMLWCNEEARSLTLEFLTLGDLSQHREKYDVDEKKMIL